MTVWVGITGGIGSGKSQAAAEFLCLGVPLIDADAISRQLTAEHGLALPAIREIFGEAVFDTDACLKRNVLRDLVFSCENARQSLEKLMYPFILKEINKKKISFLSSYYGVIELPLLIEKPIFRHVVDRILVVHSNEAMRILRVRKRSGLAEENIRSIMRAQASDVQRKQMANDILVNDGTLVELKEKIGRLHRYYHYWGYEEGCE